MPGYSPFYSPFLKYPDNAYWSFNKAAQLFSLFYDQSVALATGYSWQMIKEGIKYTEKATNGGIERTHTMKELSDMTSEIVRNKTKHEIYYDDNS